MKIQILIEDHSQHRGDDVCDITISELDGKAFTDPESGKIPYTSEYVTAKVVQFLRENGFASDVKPSDEDLN